MLSAIVMLNNQEILETASIVDSDIIKLTLTRKKEKVDILETMTRERIALVTKEVTHSVPLSRQVTPLQMLIRWPRYANRTTLSQISEIRIQAFQSFKWFKIGSATRIDATQ